MKILFYDCFSGISGDMNLGAMIDLGIEPAFLTSELKKLNLKGWELQVEKAQQHGIGGTRVTVKQTVPEHIHRHLSDITTIINNSSLGSDVKKSAFDIFTVIAEAEAQVHGIPVDHVHFHEVGAIDAIIDITGAAICFHHLKPDAVICTPLQLGGGFVKCAHGTLPVPAPATALIVEGMSVKYNGVDFEATTPTGAAILKVLSGYRSVSCPSLRISKTAYGVGHKEHPNVPNLLRVHLAECDETTMNEGHEALLIECNIDDMNPELYGHISDQLFSSGAADVFLTNISMKKGRPGVMLSVICEKGNETAIRESLFTQTTTIGLRTTTFLKNTLSRKFLTIDTEFGKVGFKFSYLGEKLVTAKPEFTDCKAIADRTGIPLKEVFSRLNSYCIRPD
jgi:pyridinium-3,5-bisthiocarboxylic acid mononucleotide nickel chelatase